MADYDVIIVGAGIVGVACAAALSRAHRVAVLERLEGPGRETTSRNSGVIHAGLYYPPGSLKATTCVEGRDRLYRRCEELDIPHRRTGKLIVATEPGEEAELEKILARATECGVTDLQWLDRPALRAREPSLSASAALYSPSSGIVDAHELLESLKREAISRGADFVFRTEVASIERTHDLLTVVARSADGDAASVTATHVVNSAGLFADRVAQAAGLDIDALGYRLHFCKGDYFALAREAPITQIPLVYPVPAGPGLGIHLTADLGGRRTAGPDATYVDSLDYRVDPDKADAFARAVARYLPGVGAAQLTADYAGMRPKLSPPGEGFRDFVVEAADLHGVPGLINLIGIESPGITASLAIAERVLSLVAM